MTPPRPGGPRQFDSATGLKLARLPENFRFALRVLRADLGNFFFVQHRRIDGFVVTGKNSGSHWLKYMLSAGIAQQHGLPLPGYSTGQLADDIVGHPSRPRRHVGIPLIGTSHTIPSLLQRWVPSWAARRPPIVVMVRHIGDALESNYRKWRAEYDAPPEAFAAGDPLGQRFVADAWWYVHFFNRWGAWAAADPERILVVRYEDLQAAPAHWLSLIAAHLRLGFDAAALRAALEFTSKDAIRTRQDPQAGEVIVPDPVAAAPFAFGPDERAMIGRILARHLRYRFGYDDFGYDDPGFDGPGGRAPADEAALPVPAPAGSVADQVAGEAVSPQYRGSGVASR